MKTSYITRWGNERTHMLKGDRAKENRQRRANQRADIFAKRTPLGKTRAMAAAFKRWLAAKEVRNAAYQN